METTKKLTRTIPSLIELEQWFDASNSTGTHSITDSGLWRDYSQRYATSPAWTDIATPLSHFYDLRKEEKLTEFPVGWLSNSWNEILREPLELLSSVENPTIVNKAKEILNAIRTNLVYFDVENLSPLRAFELEDGSIAFEWIFNHFRIGFNFEIDDRESGYFLFSDKSAGEVRSHGFLHGLKAKSLIKSLVVLVSANL
jgi:hypothetical protein